MSLRWVRQSGVQRVRMGLEERLRSRREERARIWVGKEVRWFEARLREVRLSRKAREMGTDAR